PCPYASGEESKIASGINGVSYVFDPAETSRFVLTKKIPAGFFFQKKGIVIHLGGDQFFTVMTGWRTKFPMIIYSEKHVYWAGAVDKYLVADQNTYATARLRGISPDKIKITGNLMVDA